MTRPNPYPIGIHPKGARMVVSLHAMHDPHWTNMQQQGFTSQLGKLDARYAAN